MGNPFFHVFNAGLKRIGGIGNLPKADLYIDARAFPDDEGMRSAVIASQLKADSVTTQAGEAVQGILSVIDEAIKHIPRRRRDERESGVERPFIICTFCAFGINRSVALREIIVNHLKQRGYEVDNLGTYLPTRQLARQ